MTPVDRYAAYRGPRMTPDEAVLFAEKFGHLDPALVTRAIEAAVLGTFFDLPAVARALDAIQAAAVPAPGSTPTRVCCAFCEGSGFVPRIAHHASGEPILVAAGHPCPGCEAGMRAATPTNPRGVVNALPWLGDWRASGHGASYATFVAEVQQDAWWAWDGRPRPAVRPFDFSRLVQSVRSAGPTRTPWRVIEGRRGEAVRELEGGES